MNKLARVSIVSLIIVGCIFLFIILFSSSLTRSQENEIIIERDLYSTTTCQYGKCIAIISNEIMNVWNGSEYRPREEIFRSYKGGVQDNTGMIYNLSSDGNYVNVYNMMGDYLTSFGFGVTGEIGGVNYKYTTLDFTWDWSKSINSTQATFYGDNNHLFNWIQEYNFYPDKPMKIKNKIENNLGKNIYNTKFWYIQLIDKNDVIVWNNTRYYLNKTINKEGNFNDIVPKISFPNKYIFDYTDLIENGFDITNIYVGDGSKVGVPGIWLLAVGITKGDGIFSEGASVTIDPIVTPDPTWDRGCYWDDSAGNYKFAGETDTTLAWGLHGVLGDKRRCAIDFDISAIPDDVESIDDVHLKIYVENVVGAIYRDTELYITEMVDEGSDYATAQALFQAIDDNTKYYTWGKASWATGWQDFDLGASADTDLKNRLAGDWFSLGFYTTEDNGGSAYNSFRSVDYAGTSSDPYLEVTYTSGDTTPPTCQLVSATPSNITANSTGTYEVIINCSDESGINISRYIITRTVEGGDAWGVPNYWSIRPPANNKAEEYIDEHGHNQCFIF